MSEIQVSDVVELDDRRPFFTTKSLAKRLGISERQVLNLLSKGYIPSYKILGSRRIDPVDVDRFLSEHRDEGFAA